MNLTSMHKVRATPTPISETNGDGPKAMTQNPRKTAKSKTVRLLQISDAVSNARSGDRAVEPTKEKYQLQLRVDEQFLGYMEELVNRAGVETTSELIRLALRELDRARMEFDGIKLPNEVVIGIVEDETDTGERSVVPFRKKAAIRRINVVLRGVAYRRLQRLIEWSGGLPLVDLVAIALGVLDTVLTTEEDELSSGVNQSALFEAETVSGPQRR